MVKNNSGCLKVGLIVLIVLAVLGAGVVGCIAYTGGKVVDEIARSVGTADPGDYEITNLECSTDEFGTLTATGTIKNTSDKPQGFQVTVRWVTEDDVLITDGSDFTNRMDVGQSQHWEATAFEDAPAGSQATCEVSEVEYSIFD